MQAMKFHKTTINYLHILSNNESHKRHQSRRRQLVYYACTTEVNLTRWGVPFITRWGTPQPCYVNSGRAVKENQYMSPERVELKATHPGVRGFLEEKRSYTDIQNMRFRG